MPASPYAKVLASINGGATASGGIVVPASATVQLSGVNTASWLNQLWEIYEYPVGFTAPAGWSTAANGSIYSTAVTPPQFTLPAISLWGKFFVRLTVNGGILNGALAGPGSPQPLIDIATALTMLSPNGLVDTGYLEANQFDSLRQWSGEMKRNWRKIDSLLVSILPSIITTNTTLAAVAFQVVRVNTSGGAIVLTTPTAMPVGAVIIVVDDTRSISSTNTLSFSDQGSLTWQDPDSPNAALVSTITFTATRNLTWTKGDTFFEAS